MVFRHDSERWQETTQGKILNILKTLLDLLTGYGQAFTLDGESDALYHQGGNEYSSIVVHPADVFRQFLILSLIHIDNVLYHWKVSSYPDKLNIQLDMQR